MQFQTHFIPLVDYNIIGRVLDFLIIKKGK